MYYLNFVRVEEGGGSITMAWSGCLPGGHKTLSKNFYQGGSYFPHYVSESCRVQYFEAEMELIF